MNDSNTYQAVRIGDIADWRLIGEISDRGMSMFLKHSNPTREIETLFDEKWEPSDDTLLKKIEDCVYDHPQVLDDFSADISIVAPKSIWVPSALVNDDDDESVRLYNQIYSSPESDIMSEEVEDATCLYSLVPCLNAFLQRTFPGARIHSHLAVMARRFRERSDDVPRIYAEIREGEVDILAFDRRTMLTAATHQWHEPADIQYHIFNIMNVYGLSPQVTQVSLSGLRDVKNGLIQELRKSVSFVMLTMLPTLTTATMPTTAALLLNLKP